MYCTALLFASFLVVGSEERAAEDWGTHRHLTCWEPLIGEWTQTAPALDARRERFGIKEGDEVTHRRTFRWTVNGNAIESVFSGTKVGSDKVSYIQRVELIGWNLREEKSFCFAVARPGRPREFEWKRDGNTWRLTESGTYDGTNYTREESLTLLDDETLRAEVRYKIEGAEDRVMGPNEFKRVRD